MLVPGLTPQVEAAFGQRDDGLGLFYFVTAAAYAVGSFGGGMLTERVGRRAVLFLAAVLHGAGIAGLGLAPGWLAFIAWGVVRSAGAGAIDGGMNGLIVDMFQEGRGRALSFAHIFYASGAVGAPFLLAFRSSVGLSWEGVMIATGIATIPLAVLLAVTGLASGRRPAGRSAVSDRGASMLSAPLVVLALAIGCYVAGSSGISNWLVRFLSSAASSTATSSLGFFWAGLLLGRVLNAAIADRFDHVKLAIVAAGSVAVLIVAAVLAPSVELQVALFALVGFACGPVYPLIMTIGGDRFPGRAAAMSGILSAAGVVGSLAYPPLMGVISVNAGLGLAMLGIAVLNVCAAIALFAIGRIPRVGTPTAVEG